MTRPFVEIDQVAMRYGGVDGTLALEGCSMNINQGEFVAVVGPSGCGKSTLMRLVTGLWPATEGNVVVAGQEVDGPLTIAGMAFQAPTLLPWRRILSNVMLPLEVTPQHRNKLGRDRALYEARARELLRLVGLEGFDNKYPYQLSGGMQQRTSLCRALIHDPALLMLDEPFSALDVFTREDLWAVLQNVWMAKKPTVVLVVGINGAGKTTSVAKIAKSLRDDGRTVLLGAADTFRAGAVAQLETWSRRLGVDIVKGAQGADPAAVAFDAAEAALARGVDVLLVDTAGRLHTQDNLMRQLTKIRNVIAKKIPGAPHEILLVLDATSGQNAVQQATAFKAACDVSGIFLAKLDGTAKGGIVVAIRDALDVPVKLVGVGETPDDVQPFDPDRFVEAMFAE